MKKENANDFLVIILAVIGLILFNIVGCWLGSFFE